MEDIDQNTCIDCGADLKSKKRYPVYSSRLKVTGYRCGPCNEKSKTPGARKREEEMSMLTKEVQKPENPNMDIRKSLMEK